MVLSSSCLAQDSTFGIDGSVSLKTTELPFVLFHDSPWSFRRTQASITILESIALLLDNNLTLHASVPETAGMATVERLSACRLGQELNRGLSERLGVVGSGGGPLLACST
jgi:hypothetical protein